MYALYEFSNLTVEVGRLNLIEGDYEPDVDKEYVVWWSKNGKTTAWTAKILATDGKYFHSQRIFRKSNFTFYIVDE